ncbi:MAG: discoidin domain-containing protein [Phycisphaerae bacterium]|nr:discoidin domain-containing protein [Phycisphaerae bacterium]
MKKSLCFAVVGIGVLVCLSASARVLVYEPFDYPDAPLNENGGALGTIGTWITNDTGEPLGWWCHPEGELTGQGDDLGPGGNALNLFDGTVDNLPTSGGFAGPAGPTDQSTPGTWGTRDNTGNLDGHIGLDPSVTATFKSGTTTWFSYVGAHADNRNQGSPTFMICTDPTVDGSRGLTMQNSGNGIGGVGGPPRFNLFDVYPHYFSGGVHHQTPGGYLGGVLGGHDGIVPAFCSTADCDGVLGDDATREWVVRDADGYMGVPNIVVGKIEWDADTQGEDIISVVSFLETDELSEAAFNAIIAGQPLLSSRHWPGNKPALDQSQFDTLNISSVKFFIDEIRIGTTFEDIIGGAPTKAKDPQPQPDAVDVLRDSVLVWTPGDYADTHDVYLGMVFDDVNEASRNDPRNVLVHQGDIASTYDPGQLVFGTTYYWRIDEVNAPPSSTVYKGNVWSFTVEPVSIPVAVDVSKVTASSFTDANPAGLIVDGSGLTGNMHSDDSDAMWLSAATDPSPWLMFEFDTVEKLDKVLIWNSNSKSEAFVGWGIKDVNIETSLDGVDWTGLGQTSQVSRAPGNTTYAEPQALDLGLVLAKYVRINILSNWGGLLPQYGVSEIQFYGLPVFARTPDPASGAENVLPDAEATWRPGREAVQHTLYLGTDSSAVADGSASSVTSTTNSLDLEALDLQLDQTYYWRVDEVNEAETEPVWQGPVWSFSTVPYVTIDDFEGYTNRSPNRPFQTWLDGYGYSADDFFPVEYGGNGTGAGVGHDIWGPGSPYFNGSIMEKTITVEGSSQSLPLYYSNAGVTPHMDRTWAVPQDWTVGGAQTLVLYLYGDPGNTGQPFVQVNNGAKVSYDGPASAMTTDAWTQWHVDLASLGANLQNVTQLSIGVQGGSGMILIDDIRLYRNAPEASGN